MKIAIVGAGLCGLTLTWHLLNKNSSLKITLFDPLSANQRTSSLANLLYPYIGMKSKLSWSGEIAFKKAKEILQTVQNRSPTPFYSKKGLLKIPSNLTQLQDFEKAASKYSDLKIVKDLFFAQPALWVEEALQVESEKYLNLLCHCCVEKGAQYVKDSFCETKGPEFDLIIFASGAKTKKFFKPTKSSLLKGQALILKQSKNFEIEYPIIYDGLHLIPSLNQKTLYVGNTFERMFDSSAPCKETALRLLWKKLIKLYPCASQRDILHVQAGVRLNHQDRLPKIGKLDSKNYIFTALGSKGLLYHSFLADLLARHILDAATIPQEVLFSTKDAAVY